MVAEFHVTDFGREEVVAGRGWVAEGDWLKSPAEALKQKETPTEGQGLPVSAGHLALNALSSRNTTGVRIGPASIQHYPA